MNKRGITAAVLVAGAIALTGCGSEASTAESTPTVTAPPADGGSYGTVVELRDAFVAAGGSCPEFDQTNQVTLAAESAHCSSSAVISTYVSSADVSQLIQNLKELNEEMESSVQSNPWLVGENWVINAPDAAELREKLGGRVVSW